MKYSGEDKYRDNVYGDFPPDVVSMGEYYFESRTDFVSGDISGADVKNKPRVYIEREGDGGHEYIMYLVIPQWLYSENPSADHEKESVRVLFDRDGISPINSAGRAEVDRTVSYAEYVKSGYRLNILRRSNGMYEFSGTGRIEILDEDGETIKKYAFYCNFTFRRRICYTLEVSGGKVKINASVNGGCVKDIPVKILIEKGRVPCLTDNENAAAATEDYLITFSGSGKWSGEFELPVLSGMNDAVCRLAFSDREDEKYYLLDCRNQTADSDKDKGFKLSEQTVCPYCHDKISLNGAGLKLYRRGGVACNGERSVNNPIYGERRTEKRNCMYCKSDVGGDGRLLAEYSRLLPSDYLAHTNFSIALYGSRRAGKTTFISRLFNITRDRGDRGVNMSCAHLNSLMPKIKLREYQPMLVDRQKNSTGGEVWAPWNIFGNYVTELADGGFPVTTQSDEGRLYKCPFIFSVRNRAYVHLYDIAGEDAESGKMGLISESGNLGMFLLVDIDLNKEKGNRNVVSKMESTFSENLSEIKNKENVPVAVILTKFDKHEANFSSSAHCRRGDIADMFNGIYSRSELEFNVNAASEEIKSYLMSCSYPLSILSEFKNVKYFGISLFPNPASLYHEERGNTEINRQLFSVSAKRMELPLIWMQHNFGLIK